MFATEDEALIAEAGRYGVPPSAYVAMTPRERGVVKAHWSRRVRAEARKFGISADWWVALSDEEREAERSRIVGEMVAKKKGATAPEPEEDEDSPEPESDDEEVEPGFRVYTEDPDVPPEHPDPLRRQGVTVGRITEIEPPPDVLGSERERHPRTLMDLYHRWPVGDGEHFIRVERTQPKHFQQLPCSGYLGDIREPISEKKFQQYFGGREYELTLYGPDPRGKSDPVTGLPRIKALTNPIKITVPMLPPNLAVLPAMTTNEEAKQEAQMTQQWNPFAPAAGAAAAPTTPADAQVHKSNVDLITNVLKMTQEENRELRKAALVSDGGPSKQMMDWQKEVMEAVRKDAEARERILREELAEAKRERDRKDEEIEKIRQQVQQATGRTDGTTLELVKTLGVTNAERDAQRSEYYREQMDSMRRAHQDAISTVEERHKGEISRYNERLKEMDDYYRRLLEEAVRKAEDREKQLKDEIERVRRDERDASEARVRELRERYDERLKDQEKSFEREIRTVKENWETKLSTSLATKDYELTTLRERLEEAKEDLHDARQKAEEGSDPVAVMEKAKKSAEALGFQKNEDTPKGPWERFAATAGAGLGTALQNIDQWLPQAAAAMAGGRNATQQAQVQALATPPQLAAGAAVARAARPRPRGVAWAAEGQPPTPAHVPEAPLGFQPEQPASAPTPTNGAGAAPPPPQPQSQSQSQGNVAPPPPAPPQAAPSPGNGSGGPQIQNSLGKVFGDEAVMTFLGQVDMAVNMGMEPKEFAQRFLASYRGAAIQMISVYKPDDVTEFVKGLPGAETSAILRRDGTKFLSGLWAEIAKQAQPQSQPQP